MVNCLLNIKLELRGTFQKLIVTIVTRSGRVKDFSLNNELFQKNYYSKYMAKYSFLESRLKELRSTFANLPKSTRAKIS